MTTFVSVTLYPNYPDGTSNADRTALDTDLRRAFTTTLESAWWGLDCGSLDLKYIMSCCDTLVETHDFSVNNGGGPQQVEADAPDPGWKKVGNLHEAHRVLLDATLQNTSWNVSANGLNAEVHATYRVGDVQDFPS